MEQRVCIITGANSGIGKQAAIQIANSGAHVIIACRNEERGRAALSDINAQITSGSVELKRLDMASQASIRRFAGQLKFPKIDVLIHNAADFDITRLNAQYSPENIETVWATNHVGPVLLTELLMDALKSGGGGRVITVSSKGLLVKPGTRVDLDDPEFRHKKYSVTNAYYQSKRAQEMYTVWLARQLEGSSVTANCIRVTAVKIDISRYPGLSALSRFVYSLKSKASISPAQMAKTYTYLALSDDVLGVSGKCFDEKNETVNINRSDTQSIDAVMNLTMSFIKQP